MNTEQAWLEARKKGITATDIAAICGVNPYKKPIDVYLDKRGLTEPTPDNEYMMWGRMQEPLIAEHYARRHGVELYEPGLMRSPLYEIAIGTPDRLIKGRHKGLEIKTASGRMAHRWGEPGTDEVPDEYLLQCHWYMAVTGFCVWDIAVKIDSADYREYTVEHNKKLEHRLVQMAMDFWAEHVVPGIPPECDGSEQYARYIEGLYPQEQAEMKAATSDITELLEKYWYHFTAMKDAEQFAEEYKNRIKAVIGDAAGIEGSEYRVTWKKTKDSKSIDYREAFQALADAHKLDEAARGEHLRDATKSRAGSRRFLFKPMNEGG